MIVFWQFVGRYPFLTVAVRVFRRIWPVLLLAAVFGAGVWAARTYWPRVVEVRVDREILRVVERLIPGEIRTMVVRVPGADRIVRVPVEVFRTVEVVKEKPIERVVTVTRPVEVPVEVIRREWPQTITVRVGSMLGTDDVWHTPSNPDLLIGQVAPGVYAVPAQPGWTLEGVTTNTTVGGTTLGRRPLPNLTVHPLAGSIGPLGSTLGPMIQYENWYRGGVYRVAARYNAVVLGSNGPRWQVELSWGLPIGR